MSKINQVLASWAPGDVHTLRWLESFGMNQRLAYQHAKNGNLKRIGEGVFCRPNDSLSWLGAVHAMQDELNLSWHVGSLSSLSLQGLSHQVLMGKTVDLLSYSKPSIPAWVKNNDWGVEFIFRRSSMFSEPPELLEQEFQGLKIKIASREMATLELIQSSGLGDSFESIENQMMSLRTMQSGKLQSLLKSCRSIKTKRVFLYLSREMTMPYYAKLNLETIDLGSGKRVVVKSGQLDSEFKITVPRSNEENPF